MRGFCSVHTHSRLCDGTDSLSEMAWAAYEAGAVSFGASGHSHTPFPEDEGGVLPEDMTVYRKEVLRLREEFTGRMDVLLGIELDNCADVTAEGFDYWIGSVHRMGIPDGSLRTVDWSQELLEAWEAFSRDGCAMAASYYAEVGRMAARKPTILGHVDLVAKFNEDGRFFDEGDARYRSAALEGLHAADPRETLREWRDMGGKVILTSDAHSASAIVWGYGEAAALARAAGYERAALLTASGWRESSL